jgi:hypothetical protein
MNHGGTENAEEFRKPGNMETRNEKPGNRRESRGGIEGQAKRMA